MRVLTLVLATAGAAVCAVVVASTLASGGPIFRAWVIWPLFIGFFPFQFGAVRTLRRERFELKDRLLSAPRPLLVLVAALGACAFALSMQSLLTSRGNPERHGNGYYLRNHTELTRVSRSEYRYAEREIERLFCGIALVFYLVAIIVRLPGTPAGGRRDRGAPGRTPSAAGP
jgi:hypothetical protein